MIFFLQFKGNIFIYKLSEKYFFQKTQIKLILKINYVSSIKGYLFCLISFLGVTNSTYIRSLHYIWAKHWSPYDICHREFV